MAVFKKFIMIFFILFLGACSASSSQSVILAPTAVDGVDKTASVVVFSPDQKFQELIPAVEFALVSNLNMRGTFKLSQANLESSDFILEVEILDAKRVSTGSRAALGMLAGKARITLRAKFFESGNDQPLGIVEVEGKSSSGTIFSGTTDEAIQKAVQEITQWIRARK